MKQKTKKWGFLTAAVVLALGTAAFPQGVQASTALSGTTYAGSAQATGTNSTAIGDNAKATGQWSIAIGDSTEASGTTPKRDGEANGATIAIGQAAKACGNYSTALGYLAETTTTGYKGIAIGMQAKVSGDSGIGIGAHTEVGGEETVAIGYGVTTMVTVYDQSTGQYTTTAANGATGVGSRSAANADYASALGYESKASGESSVALGSQAMTGYHIYYGESYGWVFAGAGGEYSAAVGTISMAAGNYSVAVGYGAQAGDLSDDQTSIYGLATAVGMGAGAFATNSTALGSGAKVQKNAIASLAIGANAFVSNSGTYSQAIGYEAQAQADGTLAIGYQALAATAQTTENVTTGAADSSGTLVSTVSFGHTEDDKPYVYDSDTYTYKQGEAYGSAALSRLTNIAVGKADTDAVNFSQIKITKPTSGDTYLVSSVKDDGTLDEKGTIGANLTNLDTAVVALDQLISIDDAKAKISIGAGDDVTGATEVSIKGTDNRKLTGVAYDTDNHSAAAYGQMIAAGTYEAQGTDASKAQTVTLKYNDESSSTSKVVISLDATGAVADGDKRLVNGDTVYQAIKAATKSYSGSDTVTVSTDNKISVKNMAMGDSGTTGAKAEGYGSFAIGNESSAAKDWSLAIGHGAETKGDAEKAIAIGLDAKASGNSAIVIGQYTTVGGEETVAIGYEVVTSQTVEGVDTPAAGATGIGSRSTASAEFASALGYGSAASGIAALALGTASKAQGISAIAVGFGSVASENGAVVLGALSQATGNSSTALGTSSHALGDASLAIGAGSWTYTDMANSVAIGNKAEAQKKNAVAIGYEAVASAENTVSFGHKAGDQYITSENGAYVAKQYDSDSYSKLTNVAYDTDNHSAAAYGQLISSASYANGVLTLTRADNTLDAITVSIPTSGGGTGTTYDAGNGIEITSSTTGGNPTIAVKVSGDDLAVSSAGLSVNKNGKVEAGNTGIVTGGTVYEALKDMDNQVSELSDDINKVGAGAAALAALRPEAFDPSDKWSFAVGYGHYKNANAGAIGAFFKPNADTTLSIGGTIGNGDPLMNAGVSFKLGSRSAKLPQNASNPQLVQEVNTLRAQNASQQQEITALRADNQRMKQQIEMILSKLDMSGKVSRTAR